MKITEGWELAQGVAGYRLFYSDGSTVFIDRAPNSFELQECMIEPVIMATLPEQEDKPLGGIGELPRWGRNARSS